MTVQVLFIDDCPNYEDTLQLIESVRHDLSISVDIEQIRVDSPEEALHWEFIGSPSVRVSGMDIDPAARGRRDFGIACRRYGDTGLPPRAMIAAALAVSDGNGGVA